VAEAQSCIEQQQLAAHEPENRPGADDDEDHAGRQEDEQ